MNAGSRVVSSDDFSSHDGAVENFISPPSSQSPIYPSLSRQPSGRDLFSGEPDLTIIKELRYSPLKIDQLRGYSDSSAGSEARDDSTSTPED